MHLLDNPMYSALQTEHASFASGSGLALRFPAEVAPFGGIAPGGEKDALTLFEPGERAVFVGLSPEDLTGWEVLKEFHVIQMQHTFFDSVSESVSVRLLSEDDTPAMLKLTSLVYPSYFRPETARLGEYCGIYSDTELIAMTGIRMKVPGYEEVSAICTHFDYRGKGLGKIVTNFMIQRILSRGNTPFLHTESDNPAQQMYRKLGFEDRAMLPVCVLKRA